jgi:hypothetical protein
MTLPSLYRHEGKPAECLIPGRARIGLPTSPSDLVFRAMIDRRVAITDRQIISVQARSKFDPKDGVQIVLESA